MRRTVLLFLSFACLATAACSSNSDPGKDPGADAGNDGCVAVTSDADLTTPTVSFKTDILPTFQLSCGIAGSTCHGTPQVALTQQRPFLGFPDGGTDAGEVITGLVGVATNEDPQMMYVIANDPDHSYLMHKVDGDQCIFAAACAQGQTQYTDCGQQMPYSSPPLDAPTRDAIRRWIAQGAPTN
jgi:hypothetical protein